jgi:glycosyltransferase involved in cell wall biosynthesis
MSSAAITRDDDVVLTPIPGLTIAVESAGSPCDDGPAAAEQMTSVNGSGLSIYELEIVATAPRPPAVAGPFGSSVATVSVIVPTLNEAPNLKYVLPMIPAWVSEIILVDGRSTDGTIEVAQALCPTAKVIQQTGKGKGDALREGFRAATGDIIVMLDADGSTLPSEIPGYVGALLAGADFAKGSRFAQGGGSEDISFFRWFGNSGLVVLGNLLFRGRYTDLCYGYNAFWRHHLQLLALDADGFEIETMMNLRALCRGLRVVEVPSFEARRRYGESRLRAIPDGFRVLRTILNERFMRSAGNRDARFSRRRLVVDRHPAGLLPTLDDRNVGSLLPNGAPESTFTVAGE